jgi:hypothetical protein
MGTLGKYHISTSQIFISKYTTIGKTIIFFIFVIYANFQNATNQCLNIFGAVGMKISYHCNDIYIYMYLVVAATYSVLALFPVP